MQISWGVYSLGETALGIFFFSFIIMVESNKIFFPYDENDSRTSREYDYLDNHFYSLFTENGCHFKTNEHYFQSKKFHDPEIKQLIINSETPELAKSIGLQHKINIAE